MKTRLNLLLLLLLAACSQAPVASEPPAPAADPPVRQEPTQEKNTPVVCTDPRPQVCTMIYDPVCATRDTGVRCVTTPCPSTELVTKSSSCNACSDPKVISHVKGECPAK